MLLKDYLKEKYPNISYAKAVQKYENYEVLEQTEFKQNGRDEMSYIYIDKDYKLKDFINGKIIYKNVKISIYVARTKTNKLRISTTH